MVEMIKPDGVKIIFNSVQELKEYESSSDFKKIIKGMSDQLLGKKGMISARRKTHKWTSGDIAYLKNLVNQGKTMPQICSMMKRTKPSIAHKLEDFGLTINKPTKLRNVVQSKKYPRQNKTWTKAENAMLKKNLNQRMNRLVRLLGRTKHSIQVRMTVLGLHRSAKRQRRHYNRRPLVNIAEKRPQSEFHKFIGNKISEYSKQGLPTRKAMAKANADWLEMHPKIVKPADIFTHLFGDEKGVRVKQFIMQCVRDDSKISGDAYSKYAVSEGLSLSWSLFKEMLMLNLTPVEQTLGRTLKGRHFVMDGYDLQVK